MPSLGACRDFQKLRTLCYCLISTACTLSYYPIIYTLLKIHKLLDAYHNWTSHVYAYEECIRETLSTRSQSCCSAASPDNLCPACVHFSSEASNRTLFIYIDGNSQLRRFKDPPNFQEFETLPTRMFVYLNRWGYS